MKKQIFSLLLLSICLFFAGCGAKLESISIVGKGKMFAGDNITLKVYGEPEDAKIDKVKWKSSDETIVTVDDNGVITGIGEGKATITAEVGDEINTTKSITVYRHTESIVFDKQELKLKPNEEQTLNVTISPENNEYLFESNNEMIVTISYDGKVTAKGYGKAKIIAKTEDNKEAICNVIVSVTVPDFSSMSSSEAEKWGRDNYVTVKTSTSYSDTVSSGKVISQSVNAGTEIDENGKTIEVVYSIGHKETLGESNALKSAKNYLSIMGFSAKRLKEQLEYEGYSSAEAQYAVNNCGADWNEQAAKSAKNYMELMSFSRKQLKDQLLYEGFTNEQAEYGVKSVGY